MFYLILLALIFSTNVEAREIIFNTETGYSSFDEYKETLCNSSYEYDSVIFRELNVENNTINLYCEFKSPENALINFKEKFSDTLNYIMNKYELEEISNDNWEEYKEIVITKIEEDLNATMDYMKMAIFFETYENTAYNDDIEQKLNSFENNSTYYSIESNQDLDELESLIPSYYKITGNNDSIIQPYATQKFDFDKGYAYMKKYVWNANADKYGDLGGRDCTNFASQILHEGGYNTVLGVTASNGWWYNNLLGSHHYSYSWTAADKFVDYWGKKKEYYGSNGFTQFSKDVQKGDFIAQDKNCDRKYNHMGFVSDVKSKTQLLTSTFDNPEKGICYWVDFYDFTVAQHSTNYERKVSSDKNGWDEGGALGYNHAIVRINK